MRLTYSGNWDVKFTFTACIEIEIEMEAEVGIEPALTELQSAA